MPAPFASQLMMQILQAGLQGAIPSARVDDAKAYKQNQATIPLQTKRHWVEHVAEKYGYSILLTLGRGASQFTHTPIAMALLSNASPEQVLRRWQRLERYAHSNHYCLIEYNSGSVDEQNQVMIQHQARADTHGSIGPSLGEDLAVLGVICTLLHLRGAQAIQIYCEQQLIYDYQAQVAGVDRNRIALFQHLAKVASRQWQVRWQTDESHLQTMQQFASHAPAKMLAITWHTKTKRAIKHIGLLDTSIKKVAAYLGVSERSLQRFLEKEDTGFAKLVQQVRVEVASKLLLSNRQTLAEIGFTCGYSDQAHFTRQFKQLNGMAPKAYGELYLGSTFET